MPLIPNIVGVYPGSDFYNDRATFAAFGINVSADCNGSTNSIFAFAKVLIALGTNPKPVNFSCTDTPNTPDFILGQADTTFVNGLIRSMNSHIASQATLIHGLHRLIPAAGLHRQKKTPFAFQNLNCPVRSALHQPRRVHQRRTVTAIATRRQML